MDYGFGAGPEKAIGRGKQEGDPSLGYGGDQNSSVGGGSNSVTEGEEEDEQESGRFDGGLGGFGGSRRTVFDFTMRILEPSPNPSIESR